MVDPEQLRLEEFREEFAFAQYPGGMHAPGHLFLDRDAHLGAHFLRALPERAAPATARQQRFARGHWRSVGDVLRELAPRYPWLAAALEKNKPGLKGRNETGLKAAPPNEAPLETDFEKPDETLDAGVRIERTNSGL